MTSEAVTVNWWQNLTACCNTCVTRKGGEVVTEAAKSFSNSKRVVVLGSPECGKSRVISLLADTNANGNVYTPTNGTVTTRIAHKDVGISLVEVGGSLRGFWSRTVDAKVNCLWYLVRREEYDARDFATFSTFFREASTTINTHRIPIVVSILQGQGVGLGEAENLIMAEVSDCGVFVTPSVTLIGGFEKPSLIPSLDVVTAKLAS